MILIQDTIDIIPIPQPLQYIPSFPSLPFLIYYSWLNISLNGNDVNSTGSRRAVY